MTDLNALKNLTTPPPPKGITPGVTFDGQAGWVTLTGKDGTEPSSEEIDNILRVSKLNPDELTVDWNQKQNISTHIDANGELVQAWYKFSIRKKRENHADVEELIDMMCDYIPTPEFASDKWRTVVVADTHIGKSEEDGAGTEMLAKRWMDSAAKAIQDEAPHKGINLMLAGDLIEGYVSNHGAGIAQTDRDLDEQIRIANTLVMDTVELALANAEQVIVSVCPGNHSETTRAQHRNMRDNFDIVIASNAELALNRLYSPDRLKFYYPAKNRGSVTYEAGGTNFVLVHGHKFKGKMNGAEKWWAGHINNNRPPAAATILVAGHFHGAEVKNWTKDRWIIFGSALENESTWLAELDGSTSRPGMTYFDTQDGEPCRLSIA